MNDLWLDPTFGCSGDMVLGALVSVGGSLDEAKRQLDQLDVAGWDISSETVVRNSISAQRVRVHTTEQSSHRQWSDIDRLLSTSQLPDWVIDQSRATFRRLGEAEASIHQVRIDDVHFHEVGAVDAIVDIVASFLLLHQLDIQTVTIGSFGLGHGTTIAAHGQLSVPAPATVALLQGFATHPIDTTTETVTPTGAALLTTMAASQGPAPTGTVLKSGRGAGHRDPEGYPNVLGALVLDSAETPIMISTNLDDVTAEVVGNMLDLLLQKGADDAWVTPIGMKKNRPGYQLSVLAPISKQAELTHIIFSETQTLGLRTWPVTKHVLERHAVDVRIHGSTVSVKVGPYGAKPEHSDLLRLREMTGLSLQRLAFDALTEYENAGETSS